MARDYVRDLSPPARAGGRLSQRRRHAAVELQAADGDTRHETPGMPRAAPAGPGAPTAQFFIPATASLQERRPRTLKHGDTFAVFDHNGDARRRARQPEGLYHRDTRYLSHLVAALDGQRPLLLSSTVRDDNAMLTCDLTNPDLVRRDEGQRRSSTTSSICAASRFLWNGGLPRAAGAAQLRHASRAGSRLRHRLRRRLRRPLRGARHAPRARAALRHAGAGRAPTRSRSPTPASTAWRGARVLQLRRRRRHGSAPTAPSSSRPRTRRDAQTLTSTIGCGRATAIRSRPRPAFLRRAAASRAGRCAPRRPAPPSIPARTTIFNEAVRRSVSDLYMLVTDTPRRPLSLRRHPLVQHGVRPRRADHRAADAVARPRHRPRRAAPPRRHQATDGRCRGRRRARQDPARDALRRDGGARARCRSAATTAASIPRRCSSCWPAPISSAPAIVETVRELWPNIEAALRWIDELGRPRRRRLRRVRPADATTG